MKIRSMTLAMMTLMLSAGPLMAMDSEYQQKRRQALHENSIHSGIHAEDSIEKRRNSDLNQGSGGQHRRVDEEWRNWEQTRDALQYWWR